MCQMRTVTSQVLVAVGQTARDALCVMVTILRPCCREVVTKAEGFEWVDEAKPGRSPKPG